MILSNVVMPPNGKYAVSIQDTEDETNIVWLGAPQSWDSTKMPRLLDINDTVPMSGEKPIIQAGPQNFFNPTGIQYWIPAYDTDGAGNPLEGALVVYRMEQLFLGIVPVRYRDPSGRNFVCIIENFVPQMVDNIHWQVTFDLKEIDEVIPSGA